MEVARPVRRAGRRNPPIERWKGRSGPTPTQNIPPARASSTSAIKYVSSKRTVGYSMSDRMTAHLAVTALASVVARRGDVEVSHAETPTWLYELGPKGIDRRFDPCGLRRRDRCIGAARHQAPETPQTSEQFWAAVAAERV